MGYSRSDRLVDDCTLAEISGDIYTAMYGCLDMCLTILFFTAICNYVFIDECFHIYSE